MSILGLFSQLFFLPLNSSFHFPIPNPYFLAPIFTLGSNYHHYSHCSSLSSFPLIFSSFSLTSFHFKLLLPQLSFSLVKLSWSSTLLQLYLSPPSMIIKGQKHIVGERKKQQKKNCYSWLERNQMMNLCIK